MATEDDPGREAWILLFQLFRAQRRKMGPIQNEFQLNPAQVHLLLNLDPERSMPMSDLAGALACDASYITGLVDKVESRGMVQRLPDPSDRRVKLIALTPEGVATRDKLFQTISEPPPFVSALPESDKIALRDIFLRATQSQPPPDGQA